MKNVSSFLRENWLMILVLIVPFPIIGWYWNQLPEQIPFHWNYKGEVDQYASKGVGLFFIPVMNVFLFLFLLVVSKIDPQKENYELFASQFRWIRLSIHFFILSIFVFTMLTALNYPYDFNKAMETAVLLLFLILGNFIGTVRPNYFVGIRTPWTLANEEVWKKTHRLTARVWVIGCLLMLAGVWVFDLNVFVIIGGILAMALWAVIYSYVIFQRIKPKQNGA